MPPANTATTASTSDKVPMTLYWTHTSADGRFCKAQWVLVHDEDPISENDRSTGNAVVELADVIEDQFALYSNSTSRTVFDLGLPSKVADWLTESGQDHILTVKAIQVHDSRRHQLIDKNSFSILSQEAFKDWLQNYDERKSALAEELVNRGGRSTG